MATQTTPKAFISYSWTDDDHVEWVVKLAERLRASGVDVIADFWDLKLGDDNHAYMEQMVTNPDVKFVLAVCDRRYAEKADGRKGGVGKESVIISAKLYGEVVQSKFVPLIREKDAAGKPYVPVFFDGRFHIDFSDDDAFEAKFEELLRHVFARPARQKPALGPAPAYLFEEKASRPASADKLDRLKHLVTNNKPHTRPALADYLDTLADSLEGYRIDFPAGLSTTDEEKLVLKSYRNFLPSRDTFVDFTAFASDFLRDADSLDLIHGFWEKVASYTEYPEHVQRMRDGWLANFRLISYDLFLHFIATLVKKRNYESASHFMDAEYGYTAARRAGGFVTEGVYVFSKPLHLFNEDGKTGSIIAEHAAGRKTTFADLFQVDLLLGVRRWFLPGGDDYRFAWYAKCAPLAREFDSLPLFAAATNPRGFAALKSLLRVDSPGEYVSRVNAMLKDEQFRAWLQNKYFLQLNLVPMLNVDRIGSSQRKG